MAAKTRARWDEALEKTREPIPPAFTPEELQDIILVEAGMRVQIGQDDPMIAWWAVRPDSLIDEEHVTAYEVHPSPIPDAVFDPGKTSRINVAHFMADLATEDAPWGRWQGGWDASPC